MIAAVDFTIGTITFTAIGKMQAGRTLGLSRKQASPRYNASTGRAQVRALDLTKRKTRREGRVIAKIVAFL